MAYICKETALGSVFTEQGQREVPVCIQYVEYHPWYVDLALTQQDTQEIAVAIAGFFVTMFLLRELRKRLF